MGIDLVQMFAGCDDDLPLRLEATALALWKADRDFDLITCVHGLHYIGDKLDLIARASSWLSSDGLFIATLDPSNFRFANGASAGRTVIKDLRMRGFLYNSKKHLLSTDGKKEFDLAYGYIGADDRAGPNYTGQAAVDSYYYSLASEVSGITQTKSAQAAERVR